MPVFNLWCFYVTTQMGHDVLCQGILCHDYRGIPILYRDIPEYGTSFVVAIAVMLNLDITLCENRN